jgi:hypothetical protein
MPTAVAENVAAEPIKSKFATRPKNADGSALYPDYLPFYDPLEKVEDIGEFEHFDPGRSLFFFFMLVDVFSTATDQTGEKKVTVRTPSCPTCWQTPPRLSTCRRMWAQRSRACSSRSCPRLPWTSWP